MTDRRTDGRTDGRTGKNNMSPDPVGGRHKKKTKVPDNSSRLAAKHSLTGLFLYIKLGAVTRVPILLHNLPDKFQFS